MKTIHCSGCHIKVAEIEKGSKIKKGTVMLCGGCETKREFLEMTKQFGSRPTFMDNIFWGEIITTTQNSRNS